MPVNPFSTSNVLLTLLSLCLIVFIGYTWRSVQHKAPLPLQASISKPAIRFVCFYSIYFLAISILAANRFFEVVTMPPRFLLIFLPLGLIIFLVTRASVNGSLGFVRYLPPGVLAGVHLYRLFIEIIFVRFANEGIIPVELSIHGRNYDMVIGILALPVAWLLWKKHPISSPVCFAFNVLGLLSLLNIFTIAVPSMPSPFRVYAMNYLPTYFPGILIVFLVTAAICLHILSLKQLLWAKRNRPEAIKRSLPKNHLSSAASA